MWRSESLTPTVDSAEILPANSDYWIKKTGDSIFIGKRGSKEVALKLEGDMAAMIYRCFLTQKKVEMQPMLHLHDDDLDVYEWAGEEFVRVRREASEINSLSSAIATEGGFDNPLIVERRQILDNNCHSTARDAAKEFFNVATKKVKKEQPNWVDKNTSEKIGSLSFPVVVRIYEHRGRYSAEKHSLVVIGRDEQTNEPICFEKVSKGLPYRILALDKILDRWKSVTTEDKKLHFTFAGPTVPYPARSRP